jgi:hypothetical protein
LIGNGLGNGIEVRGNGPFVPFDGLLAALTLKVLLLQKIGNVRNGVIMEKCPDKVKPKAETPDLHYHKINISNF